MDLDNYIDQTVGSFQEFRAWYEDARYYFGDVYAFLEGDKPAEDWAADFELFEAIKSIQPAYVLFKDWPPELLKFARAVIEEADRAPILILRGDEVHFMLSLFPPNGVAAIGEEIRTAIKEGHLEEVAERVAHVVDKIGERVEKLADTVEEMKAISDDEDDHHCGACMGEGRVLN